MKRDLGVTRAGERLSKEETSKRGGLNSYLQKLKKKEERGVRIGGLAQVQKGEEKITD